MKKIKIGNKEYTMEFTFAAAECRECVQKMFWLISGAYMYKRLDAVSYTHLSEVKP